MFAVASLLHCFDSCIWTGEAVRRIRNRRSTTAFDSGFSTHHTRVQKSESETSDMRVVL
jgi:flavorubredoxin